MVPRDESSRRVEHDFHAAVLLGFEGLVEIGAVRKIRAAVGNEEGELETVSAVFSHGLSSFESPAARSIAELNPVRPKGPTPIEVQSSTPIDNLASRAPAERAENTGILRRRQRRASRP
jgi:hypothetical protein